ncbi:MAG: carbohydrate kinase [Spirochaetales bacterium]|jgi:fructokinase|nr:carbohydrate kinase [Spirochaetales bacterium]
MNVLSFGEILWDIIEGRPYLGGAVFNLTAHLSLMGAGAAIISALGNDDLGRKALQDIQGYGIEADFIEKDHPRPTGTVDVFLDQKGHPDYTIHENTAWDNLSLGSIDLTTLSRESWDVFCVGTLAQRTEFNRNLLTRVFSAIDPTHVFYDVNLRQNYYDSERISATLHRSTIAKLNDDEVDVISQLFYKKPVSTPADEEAFVKSIYRQFNLQTVLVTRGGAGALVFDGSDFSTTTCQKVTVVDTVGAGDSFSAGFLFSYLSGRTVHESAVFAGRIADFVVGKRGAIPEYTQDIVRDLHELR